MVPEKPADLEKLGNSAVKWANKNLVDYQESDDEMENLPIPNKTPVILEIPSKENVNFSVRVNDRGK